MTPAQAPGRTLGLLSIPLALAISVFVEGGVVQSTLLAIFSSIYNDFKSGDGHWLVRNLLNAAGFTPFASRTLEVALQSSLSPKLIPWISLISLIVGTSVHVQDMYDHLGDATAGRRTLPLVIGCGRARWSIAVVSSLLVFRYCWILGSIGAGMLGHCALTDEADGEGRPNDFPDLQYMA